MCSSFSFVTKTCKNVFVLFTLCWQLRARLTELMTKETPYVRALTFDNVNKQTQFLEKAKMKKHVWLSFCPSPNQFLDAIAAYVYTKNESIQVCCWWTQALNSPFVIVTESSMADDLELDAPTLPIFIQLNVNVESSSGEQDNQWKETSR